jgi:hypothetical protein
VPTPLIETVYALNKHMAVKGGLYSG